MHQSRCAKAPPLFSDRPRTGTPTSCSCQLGPIQDESSLPQPPRTEPVPSGTSPAGLQCVPPTLFINPTSTDIHRHPSSRRGHDTRLSLPSSRPLLGPPPRYRRDAPPTLLSTLAHRLGRDRHLLSLITRAHEDCPLSLRRSRFSDRWRRSWREEGRRDGRWSTRGRRRTDSECSLRRPSRTNPRLISSPVPSQPDLDAGPDRRSSSPKVGRHLDRCAPSPT